MNRWLQISITMAVLLILGKPPLTAQEEGSSHLRQVETKQGRVVTVGESIRHDVSPPLSELIKNLPPPTGYGINRVVPLWEPEFLRGLDRVETAHDPLARGPSGIASPTALLSANGYDSDDNVTAVGGRVMPPDSNGAVGLDYYVEYVNLGWEYFDKETGVKQGGPFPGNTFWDGFGGPCETHNSGDAIVLYDQDANRWVFSQFTQNVDGSNRQCFAVTAGSDPAGPYNRYEFDLDNDFADFPKIGMWTDQSDTQSAYHMTSNQIGSGFTGVQLTAFDRDAMLSGAPATFVAEFITSSPTEPFRFALLPANIEGAVPPAGMCGLYIDVFDDETWGVSGFPGPDGYQFWEYCVDFTTPANSTFTTGPFVTTSEFDAELCGYSRNCVPQIGTTQRLDTMGQYSGYPFNVRYSSSLGGFRGVASHTVDLGGDLAGIRWAQFDIPSLAGVALADTGTLDMGDTLHRWMPAISIDQDGNIGMVYSRSGTSEFPSVYFAGRMSGDAPGILREESVCVDGTGVQLGGNRWGDYSSVFVDPEDDCTFFVTGEFVETTGNYEWDTQFCTYRFASCGEVALFEDGFESGDTSAWSDSYEE